MNVEQALKNAGVNQEGRDDLPSKATLKQAHRALHDGIDTGRQEINGEDVYVDERDTDDKDLRLARFVDYDMSVLTQNLEKKSRHTYRVKMRRANGKTYDLSWAIHDEHGYVAKIETTENGTKLEWL